MCFCRDLQPQRSPPASSHQHLPPSTPPTGADAFTVYNAQHGLCLEETAATGQVVLRGCSLYSESQQWTWTEEGMLMSLASSRCLSASQNEPVRTDACEGHEADLSGQLWDCDRSRLISRSTAMQLSFEGQHLLLGHGGEGSKWTSVEKGDICREKLERKFRRRTGAKVPCFLKAPFC